MAVAATARTKVFRVALDEGEPPWLTIEKSKARFTSIQTTIVGIEPNSF
jgi:hypothetical protein